MKTPIFGVRYVALCLLLTACVGFNSVSATAQQAEAVNYDVEVNLIASMAEGGGKLPSRLDAVARQLRASLAPANYRLAATFLGRVKDKGNLRLNGVVSPLFQLPSNAENARNVATYSTYIVQLNGVETATNGELIDISSLVMELRVPVVSSISPQGQTILNYEQTGINTGFALRENAPTVVGTITTSRADELLVLVVTMRRAGR